MFDITTANNNNNLICIAPACRMTSEAQNRLVTTTFNQWSNSAGTVKFSRNGVPPPVSGVPPPELTVPPPPGIVLMVHAVFFGQFSGNSLQPLPPKAKMHLILFRTPLGELPQPAGALPQPAGAAYSTPPEPLAGFMGPTSKRKEGKGGKGNEREEKG